MKRCCTLLYMLIMGGCAPNPAEVLFKQDPCGRVVTAEDSNWSDNTTCEVVE